MATKIFKVDIDPDVADGIRKLFDSRGVGYAAGTESLFRWLMKQDEMLQLLLVGNVPEAYRKQVAEMILKRISGAHAPRGGLSRDDEQEGRQRKTG